MQEYEEGQQMVCCDTCGGWYHLKCCAVTAAAARNAETWECPVCQSASCEPAVDHVEPHLQRIHRTRCPSVGELREALQALVACAARLPEEGVLRSALADFGAWEDAVAAAAAAPPGRPGAPGADAWCEIARQSAALEVDASAQRVRALHRLRVERWAAKAAATLARSGGVPLPDMQAVLAKGAALQGAAESVAFKRASSAVADVRRVQERGKAIMTAIKAASSRTPDQARCHTAPLIQHTLPCIAAALLPLHAVHAHVRRCFVRPFTRDSSELQSQR